MSPEFVTTLGTDMIKVVLLVSAPILICGMAVGLAVSILQAVTQIQEMTLTFVPKIIVVLLAVLAFAPWMMELIVNYTSTLFINIPQYVK